MFSMAHVGIIVSDIEKSTNFYKEAFESQIVSTHEDDRIKIVCLRAGDGVIELLKYKNDESNRISRGRIDHIALYVPDIEEAVERVKKLGGKMLFDSPRPFEDTRIFFVEGLDGERIEFVEKK